MRVSLQSRPHATLFLGILGGMSGAGRKVDDMRPEFGPLAAGERIAALAGRQYGVVSRVQLRDLGLSDRAISRRLADGRLLHMHHGVYAVGHSVLTVRGRWMSAVLAGGPGAVLSHASAAAFWELRRSSAVLIDVTTRRTGRARRGLRIHRPRTLRPDETTIKDGIPVTTPARTILDLAATLQAAHLESVLDRNEILELTNYPALAALARARPGHHGAHKLLETLRRYDAGANLTRSGLEVLFRQVCHDHGLPQPRVNTTVEGKEVDFLFEHARLIVEADSWRYHKTRRAFDADRARDARHLERGHRTVRFTDRQVDSDPTAVARTLRTLLAAA